MSHASPASLIDMDMQPGKLPVVRAEAGGGHYFLRTRPADAAQAVLHGYSLIGKEH